jgi:hypothetical protein
MVQLADPVHLDVTDAAYLDKLCWTRWEVGVGRSGKEKEWVGVGSIRCGVGSIR